MTLRNAIQDFNLTQYVNALLNVNESNYNVNKNDTFLATLNHDIEKVKEEIVAKLDSIPNSNQIIKEGFEESSVLSTKLNEQLGDCHQYLDSIEHGLLSDLQRINAAYKKILEKDDELRRISKLLKKLEAVHKEIKLSKELMVKRQYETVLSHIEEATKLRLKLLEEINTASVKIQTSSAIEDIKEVLKAVKVELTVQKEQFIYDLKDTFKSHIKVSNNGSTSLRVSLLKCFSTRSEYDSFIRTLLVVNELDHILTDISILLTKNILEPLLQNKIYNVSSTAESNNCFKIELSSANFSSTIDIFEMLKKFFMFLKEAFIMAETESFASSTIISSLGRLWYHTITTKMIELYLIPSMPKKREQLSQYKATLKKSQDLTDVLEELGYIHRSESAPLAVAEFSSNIHFHFTTRLCKDYVIRAKDIICQELHNYVRISKIVDQNGTMQFPACEVSKSTDQFVELITEIFQEANNWPSNADMFYKTIYDICELYLDISVIRHRKYLVNLPQICAVFHNCCIYLAYRIQKIANENRSRLSSDVFEKLYSLVPLFKEMGRETFMQQLYQQRRVLIDFLQDPYLLRLLANHANDENSHDLSAFDKAIKQCLVHLQNLSQMWGPILPATTFNKIMGLLVSYFIDEVIHRITTLEDISVDAASVFVRKIDEIAEKAQTFFEEKSKSMYNVKNWNKMEELRFLLKVSFLYLLIMPKIN